MQIVINISEKMYENALNDRLCGSETLVNAIKNGTPLLEGHGKLIDVSDIEWAKHREERNYIDYDVIDWDDIVNAPTIIEADKAGSEE